MINYIKLIRIHQWSKNILIFLPLFFSHQLNNGESLYFELIGFISFSLCASSTYIINDIFDLESDRKHPTKKKKTIGR